MMMPQEENSLKELEALQKTILFGEITALHPLDLNDYYAALREKSFATSYGMGWKGLQAVRLKSHGVESCAVITRSTHGLGLSIRPPEKMELRYEGVKRDLPLPAGSISVAPAGVPCCRVGRGAATGSTFILSRPRHAGGGRVVRIGSKPDGGATTRWLERA
jgi:hypothetical protein